MIGEAGKEAVIPLENNTGWMADLANMIGAVVAANNPAAPGGGQGDIYLDRDKVGRALYGAMKAEGHRQGHRCGDYSAFSAVYGV